jgi:oligopeptide/dipeptide ABC transporter ATP-binding protein
VADGVPEAVEKDRLYLRTDSCKMALLEVIDLKAYFFTTEGIVRAVDGVSFELDTGKTLGLVGESGCGKTTIGYSIVNLLPRPAGRIVHGHIMFDGEDLACKSQQEMQKYRGSQIAMIVQDPMSSLDPMFTIGNQIGEAITVHRRLDKLRLKETIVGLLEKVRIPAPRERIADYPHQFSGGMRQRAVGAIALACDPRLIIADEPTTSLDVTIQAQYLALLRGIQDRAGMAMLFITHDFGIVAYLCTDIAVMYAGKIVEIGAVLDVYDNPVHPYTQALIHSVPRADLRVEKLSGIDGAPPSLVNLPPGCAFAPRCTQKTKQCEAKEFPPTADISLGHRVWCWRYV